MGEAVELAAVCLRGVADGWARVGWGRRANGRSRDGDWGHELVHGGLKESRTGTIVYACD
ncbi:hypothetical protein E2562_036078 [Oryza meyeriana var. granulata]|uniref:Uncharacterized protein n=1 Tax=Oryza meyeriana var. granulata TaxID=110450 RepID=A0A6G1CX36_9ORYZ|nr:hypothetical protein E2562_036078 [Oryza meyeriana var. granulata]